MFITLIGSGVGKPTIRAFGKTWWVADFMGRVMIADIGKRVYLTGGVLRVENNEQRNERIERARDDAQADEDIEMERLYED